MAGGVVQRVARGGDVGVVTRVEFIQALGGPFHHKYTCTTCRPGGWVVAVFGPGCVEEKGTGRPGHFRVF